MSAATAPLRIVVVGAGPAGMALAAALGERGLETTLLDPDPGRPFVNSYGMWADEADDLGLSSCVVARTRSTRVCPSASKIHDLPRGYARLSSTRLQEHLRGRLQASGVSVAAGEASAATSHDRGTTLHLASGEEIEGALVVDATGHRPALLTPTGPPEAWQVAYGQTLRVRRNALPADTAILMDFSPVDERDQEGPTFLYAMPEGDGRLFVEETILATTKPPKMPWLKDRLIRRLATLNIQGEVLDEERCLFPMGAPLPKKQSVLGFGAAAGLVHPATGYLLARTLRLASPVADALLEGLNAGARGAELASYGWQVLWPEQRLASHRLHRFGLDVLLALDKEQTRQFFDAFFLSGGDGWRTYLDADASSHDLAAVMLSMTTHLPASLVRILALRALRRPSIVPELGSYLPRLLLPKRSTFRLRSTL